MQTREPPLPVDALSQVIDDRTDQKQTLEKRKSEPVVIASPAALTLTLADGMQHERHAGDTSVLSPVHLAAPRLSSSASVGLGSLTPPPLLAPPSILKRLETANLAPTAKTISLRPLSFLDKKRDLSGAHEALSVADCHEPTEKFEPLSVVDFYESLSPNDFPTLPEIKSQFKDASEEETLRKLKSTDIKVFMQACFDEGLLMENQERIDALLEHFITLPFSEKLVIRQVSQLCSIWHNKFSLENLARHVMNAIKHDRHLILERLAIEGGLYCLDETEKENLIGLVKDKPLCKLFVTRVQNAFEIASVEELMRFRAQHPCVIFWKNFDGRTLIHEAVCSNRLPLIAGCMPDKSHGFIGIDVFAEKEMRCGFTPLMLAANLGRVNAVTEILNYKENHQLELNTPCVMEHKDHKETHDPYSIIFTPTYLSWRGSISDDHACQMMKILSSSSAPRHNFDLVMLAGKKGLYNSVVFALSKGYEFDRPVNEQYPLDVIDNEKIQTLLADVQGLFNSLRLIQQNQSQMALFKRQFKTLYEILGDSIFNLTSASLACPLQKILGFGPWELNAAIPEKLTNTTQRSLFVAVKTIIVDINKKKQMSNPRLAIDFSSSGSHLFSSDADAAPPQGVGAYLSPELR